MWTRRDWALATTYAIGTFGLTLATFWGGPLNAVDQQPKVTTVETPTFRAGDCEVTAQIVSDDQILGVQRQVTYIKSGGVPKMQLVVVNTSHQDAQTTFHVDLQNTQARDRMSRVMRIPAPSWSQDYDLSLKGDEKKVIEVGIEKVTTADNDMLSLNIGNVSGPQEASKSQVGGGVRFNMRNATTLVSMVVAAPPAEQPSAPQAVAAAGVLTK